MNKARQTTDFWQPRLLMFFATILIGGNVGAQAASFRVVLAKYGHAEMGMFIGGEIISGDARRLKAAIRAADTKYSDHRMRAVALDSPGGLLAEALKMAGVIHEYGFASIVPDGASCVSSCVLLFAAGSQEIASPTAQVGVHGVSNGSAQTVTALAATAKIAKVYAALGVPASVIGRMVATPPEDVAWLSAREIYLFPNGSIYAVKADEFPNVGAGLDAISGGGTRPVGDTRAYQSGYWLGYHNPGFQCGNLTVLGINLGNANDASKGCEAGKEASRRDGRAGPLLLPSKQPKTTFGTVPPHKPQIVKRARDYSDGYKNGFLTVRQPDCGSSVSDWCRGFMAGRDLHVRWSGPFPTAGELARTDSAQSWLDSYDYAYTHKTREGECGNGSSPTVDGCEAGAAAWPHTEGEK